MTQRFTPFAATAFSVLLALCACNGNPTDTVTQGPQCHGSDPNTVDWEAYTDLTSSQFSAKFDQLKGDFRVIDVEAYEGRAGMLYAAVWRRNTDKRKWAEQRDLTDAEYATKWQQYKDAGMRPIDVEAYQVGGTWMFAGVWEENCEGEAWVSFRNLTDTEFTDTFNQYSALGFMPIDIEAGPADDANLYSVIWHKNTKNLNWAELRNMTAAEYASNFAAYAAQGYRVLDLESYVQSGQQRYAAIWVENENSRAWQAVRDMPQTEWENRWRDGSDRGLRVIDVDVYPTPTGGAQYLAVLRQTGDRYDWPEKDAVDARVQQFMSDYNLPAISTVIMQNGKPVYCRGFGQADFAAGKAAWSKTVYRTASVAKSITAIAAMRLKDQGFIDLDQPTRFYVPSLPAHHTHTLRNLLSHRACVRHYVGGDPVFSSPGYAFATDALVMFQDDPLQGFNGGAVEVCDGPNQAYSYSTHAFTIFAAACEQAVGNFPYSVILTQMISDPFNLSTLKQEDRAVANYERAEIYDETNAVVTNPQDVTWKLAGGGMEITTYELAQLASMLIDNKLMPNARRTEMWTAPDGLSSYALGWSRTTHSGRAVYTHNGEQEGARTVWRLYPNERLVIAVMVNRRVTETPNNSIDNLASDLADIVLP